MEPFEESVVNPSPIKHLSSINHIGYLEEWLSNTYKIITFPLNHQMISLEEVSNGP